MTAPASSPVVAAADQWGPFAPGLEPGERVARLRVLRAVVHMTCGPRGAAAEVALTESERDPTRASAALAAVYAMPSLDRRRVLATYATLARPAA